MEKVLFFSFTEADGSLGRPALEALTAAVELAAATGSELSAGIVGKDAGAAAGLIAGCGAKRFLSVSGADFHPSRYGTDAAAVTAVCREAEATIVIAPATSRMSRIMAGVAHRLNGKADTHIGAAKSAGGKVSVTRWYYRQRMEAELSRAARPWILVVDPGNREPWASGAGAMRDASPAQALPAPGAGNAAITEVAVTLDDAAKRTGVEGTVSPSTGEQTIKPEARLLFVAGAGWTKKQADGAVHAPDAARLILDFLKKSQASLGGSKSVVEASTEGESPLPFMTHLNQVGQTGSTPRHPKGLSTCCHGEEPHVVGWRFVNARRAINLDANCGWARGKADVVYVADAFKLVAKVNELLAGK